MDKYVVKSTVNNLIFFDLDSIDPEKYSVIDHVSGPKQVVWEKVVDDDEDVDYVCLTKDEQIRLIDYLDQFKDNFPQNVPLKCDDDGEFDGEDGKDVLFLLSKTDVGKKKYDLDFEVIGIITLPTT